MRVRYQRRALRDIENIQEFIEKRNPRAAVDVVARIRRAAERLGTLPYMVHPGRDSGTYEWVVVGLPYIIVCEIDEATNEVAIVAIFHGAQRR